MQRDLTDSTSKKPGNSHGIQLPRLQKYSKRTKENNGK